MEAESVLSNVSGALPWIDVNDEGLVLAQWQNDRLGLLFLFSGDGTFTAATRDDDDHRYVERPEEFPVAGGIPTKLLSLIMKFR